MGVGLVETSGDFTVGNGQDWEVLRRFDADGDNRVAGAGEMAALTKALRKDGKPLTAEQATAAVQELDLKDKAICKALIEGLTSPNVLDFEFKPGTAISNRMLRSGHGEAGTAIEIVGPKPAVPGTVSRIQVVRADGAPTVAKTASTKGPAGVASEDGSFDPDVIEMGYAKGDPTSLAYIQLMAAIGQEEGFNLVIQCRPVDVDELTATLSQVVPPDYQGRITIVSGDADSNVWTQDNGEFALNGKIIVPPRLDEDFSLRAAITEGRRKRGRPDDIGHQGRVNEDDTGKQKMQAAAALKGPVVQAKTYIEGGNLLTGVGANGKPYALVGKDTVAINQAWLSKSLGRKVSEAETLATMAADLHLPPKSLHAVEQPGEFHLDMRMTTLPNGDVLLNDAMEVYHLQETWLRDEHALAKPPADSPAYAEWEKRGQDLESKLASMKTDALATAEWEQATLADLTKAGITVHRMAGAFPAVRAGTAGTGYRLPQMNFMNAVQFRNDQGGRVAVLLGGTAKARAYVERKLLHDVPTGTNRLYFLNETLTEQTLRLQGGINCRSKLASGKVVPTTATAAGGTATPGAAGTKAGPMAVSGAAIVDP